jgi:hypothetical protein
LAREDCQDTKDSLQAAVRAGEQQLWVAIEDTPLGFSISQVEVSPRFKTLWIMYCGGDRIEEWGWHMLDVFEDFARHMKCQHIEFRGRHGWMKYAPDSGYKDVARIYRKTL